MLFVIENSAQTIPVWQPSSGLYAGVFVFHLMGDYIGGWPWALLEEHPSGESPRGHFHLCDMLLSEMVSRIWVQKWLQMPDWLENIFWILRVACMEIYLNHAVIGTVWVSLLVIRQATKAYLCSQRYLALPKEELHWEKHVDIISHFSLCTSKKKGKVVKEKKEKGQMKSKCWHPIFFFFIASGV